MKYLDRIDVQLEESKNFYQQRDYKILPPEATNRQEAQKFWDITPAMQEMPINSVIAVPQNGDTVKLSPQGTAMIKGYALPQGDHGPVVRVEISVDNGKSWCGADIMQGVERSKWCWVLWTAVVQLEKGQQRRILSRATDAGGNTQAKNPQWNLRGVGYNGYGESRDLTVIAG